VLSGSHRIGGHAGADRHRRWPSLCQAGAVPGGTFLGNLKTAYSGTYHAFDFAKYAHRYLAEAQYRFNRRFDLSSILNRLLVAAVGTKPRPERFLRAAEHCG
jgi:ISXO2-like transposase domain